MSFKTFQDTRQFVDKYEPEGYAEPIVAYVYEEGYFIECLKNNGYMLTIGNDTHGGSDLLHLEKLLYEYACATNGYDDVDYGFVEALQYKITRELTALEKSIETIEKEHTNSGNRLQKYYKKKERLEALLDEETTTLSKMGQLLKDLGV